MRRLKEVHVNDPKTNKQKWRRRFDFPHLPCRSNLNTLSRPKGVLSLCTQNLYICVKFLWNNELLQTLSLTSLYMVNCYNISIMFNIWVRRQELKIVYKITLSLKSRTQGVCVRIQNILWTCPLIGLFFGVSYRLWIPRNPSFHVDTERH